jgi:hypothetical protein
MKIIVQCAGSKEDGGTLLCGSCIPVHFVARPRFAPRLTSPGVWANPDDVAPGCDYTWRTMLTGYNEQWEQRPDNPRKLLHAYQLYTPAIYGLLVLHFGLENVYILSAGWGLVRASFLLPVYDITLSNLPKEEKYKQRDKCIVAGWKDYRQLEDNLIKDHEPLVFIGGKSYWELFRKLCPNKGQPVMFYTGEAPAAKHLPRPAITRIISYGKAYTNWHYQCAKDLVNMHQSGSLPVYLRGT